MTTIDSIALSQTTTFREAELEAAFRRDGYVVVDVGDEALRSTLMEGYDRLESGIDEGYYPSLMSEDLAYKADTHRFVTDEVWPHLDAMIEGYKPLLGVYMVKHPGPDTEVPPHQDWIVTDESRRPTMNIWMPLTPVTEETGVMRVLPGSHHWLTGLRGSPAFPTQWEEVWQQVRDELMEPVQIEVGQAMVYDIRILHGTPPNRSEATRIVTSLYAIPEDQTPIHYHRDAAGTVSGYEVPDDFCATFSIGDTPEGQAFVRHDDYDVERLSFDEIAARHRANRR